MSDVIGMFGSGSLEIRQAICVDSGKVVRVYMHNYRSREIRLWWPIPLAILIWLAIIWKFGNFLTTPKVQTSPPASIEASFVELPEEKPVHQAARPKIDSSSQLKQAKKLPTPDVSHPADIEVLKTVSSLEPAPSANSEYMANVAPPTDLLAYVRNARERRRAVEVAAEQENADAKARERGPSADEIRMANIRRNLQPEGTNGIFQIVSIGTRIGKFSFRGWTNDYSNAQREMIEVDAGLNGDVEHAMVRRMIELIRKYYKGDFNWESQRLDRVIVLSARIEDNAGLEEFMMREFFGIGARR
jgi:hypothetical protein